jgi:N-acetylglucosamine-6-phosphate deacetylase
MTVAKNIISGTMVIKDELFEGEIHFQETITQLKLEKKVTSPSLFPLILPGFTDLHIHGACGFDFMEGENSTHSIAKFILSKGTTSFLGTTITAEYPDMEKAFLGFKKIIEQKKSQHSRCLGVHLEGPYINPKHKGAHREEKIQTANIRDILNLNAIAPIKIITIAPEIPGHLDLIQNYHHQFHFQIGHTAATFEETQSALCCGAKSFTHLFNAMSPLHHRAPGAVGAALLSGQYSELIPDLLHVHPGAIQLALKNIPNLYFVTDSTHLTGLPDGSYQNDNHLGGLALQKCANGIRLTDGTLAGSSLTMDMAFKNLRKIGLSIPESSKRLSYIPNKFLFGEDKNLSQGLLQVGSIADLILMNESETMTHIYSQGELFIP